MTIYQSPFGGVELSSLSITERVFAGLAGREAETVLTDGPSGRALTAAAFVEAVRRLAGGLVARGLQKGTRIALMAPNCPEFCVIFHGVAYAGLTVTTINPTYTAHEVHHQLNDAGAVMLITIPAFIATAQTAVAGTGVTEIVAIGEAEGATPLAALMGAPLAAQVPVDIEADLVVLPYSSGTTGLPKGVMLTHRNLVVNVDQIQPVAHIRPGEVTVGFLPLFHIYGMTVLMNLHLACGGAVVTIPRFDLELFLRLNQEHRARRMWLVPPVALALAKHPMIDQFDLSATEIVFSGAAPLGADIAEAVAARLHCTAMQGYGMTEMSPVSHATPETAPRAGAVGFNVLGTECRIVDRATGMDMEPGEEGELWVRGPQVMKGYLNNPTATAETLTEDGWLKTGDIGVYDQDGYLFIRDRLKELIKYKGFQVAPAELEAVLLTLPSIRDVAVIGVPDAEAGEVPMAFVVPTDPAKPPSLAEVQAHVAGELSHYKQVQRMEIAEAIPKSASGKILRRLLRDKIAA